MSPNHFGLIQTRKGPNTSNFINRYAVKCTNVYFPKSLKRLLTRAAQTNAKTQPTKLALEQTQHNTNTETQSKHTTRTVTQIQHTITTLAITQTFTNSTPILKLMYHRLLDPVRTTPDSKTKTVMSYTSCKRTRENHVQYKTKSYRSPLTPKTHIRCFFI